MLVLGPWQGNCDVFAFFADRITLSFELRCARGESLYFAGSTADENGFPLLGVLELAFSILKLAFGFDLGDYERAIEEAEPT